ncbi:phycobiliprotein lyase [Spirulina subsalsa FACHB-351]|uniref:Chromophore lyase CpcS/CpeS n=1 Tax=Spirulina subsalsa FACHB-351 TaxID=234711 RepID=A0ABT3KZU4_9CYAN|nr:phycobiliprotein lyase [Spirulina subsalsa]MCW6034741.1 phycobiliprotein lyase [Spirulina subsalsa FACHB-351]
MDGLTFFEKSAGTWRSQRTTHHLPFRRAETGGSEITVTMLPADDPRIIEICQMHDADPSLTVGGALVSWEGSMAWDKEGEEHKGKSVFALIPDGENPKKGKLLRERGYAEIVPVAGEYEVDEEEALNLVTEYETMSVIERFWFPSPDIRLRMSTVKRFGGFNTATFCAEVRVNPTLEEESAPVSSSPALYAVSGW